MNVAQLEQLQKMCDSLRTKITTIDVILSVKFPALSATANALSQRAIALRKELVHQEYLSSNKELRSMYKRVAQRTHPDKDGGCADKFNAARDAYEKGDVIALSKIANSVGLATRPSDELLEMQAKSLVCEYQMLQRHALVEIANLWDAGSNYSKQLAQARYEGYIKDKIAQLQDLCEKLTAQIQAYKDRQEPVADNGTERLPQPVALLQTLPQAAAG